MKQKQQNETKNEKGECHENVAALEWRSFKLLNNQIGR